MTGALPRADGIKKACEKEKKAKKGTVNIVFWTLIAQRRVRLL
jgi:hypothetical protein